MVEVTRFLERYYVYNAQILDFFFKVLDFSGSKKILKIGSVRKTNIIYE